MTSIAPSPVWIRRFAKFVAFATLFLIFAGAMVTSTGSGLAVPDWPLSYGMLMPPMVGGIFYEHGHRMIAATVGLLTVLQAIGLQRREPKRFVRMLGWVAVAVVLIQGLLGGLTVLFFLPPAISIGHAGLAEIFFCINVAIAFFTSRTYSSAALTFDSDDESWSLLPRVLAAAVYLQIIAGAVMRHLGAGLAIPDFPLSFGRAIPPLHSLPVIINFTHRAGAALVLALVIVTGLMLQRRSIQRGRRAFLLISFIVTLQILLGAMTVWSQKHPTLTSFHVATGALLMATSLILALREGRAPAALAQRRMEEVTA